MVDAGTNRMLISALKRKPLSLTLSNKNLNYLPESIGKIVSIKSIDLKNNKIKDLPASFSNLIKVRNLFSYNYK